jgi:hypothetical protein
MSAPSENATDFNEYCEVVRPGISSAFLKAQNIRHVDAVEAESLLGFRPRSNCTGIWIPYHDSYKPGSLIVNGRPFGRLRLDKPTPGAKYLSPKEGGAQLYVPINAGPFGKQLVITEGEFKGVCLCEAGIRAVAIGGISSAMSQGKFIPALEKLLSKWPPETVYFLGDADTALIFAFSFEAVKLAKVLPNNCSLRLPRIPFNMPNGIDDCRESLGNKFPAFWEKIKTDAIEVDQRLPAGALATKLATRELPAIAKSANNEIQIRKLSELASYLDPISLESLAKAASKILNLPIAAFRKMAKEIASQRKEQIARKNREQRSKTVEDVAQTVNDPRPKIEIPASRSRLSSEFAKELGPILAKQGFFAKDGIVVCPDAERASLSTVTARAFRTRIEDYVIPFRVIKSQHAELIAFNRTISKEEAETVLESKQFIQQLPIIRAVNNVRLPVNRASGRLELLPEGYDPHSMIFTASGGPEVEDPGPADSRSFLHAILDEFCFLENDRERATAVIIAAMLTLFVSHIIPTGAQRPGFLYTANAEGSGKTLLARLAIIPRIGFTPTGSLPEQEEEIQKRVFSAAVAGSPVFFLDNGKRHVSSGALESALTAPFIEGRILGKSQMLFVENMMTVFLTGNGATISPDLRRRVLHVDLFLREAKAEDRKINYPLDEPTIRDLRPAILSALWGITLDWAQEGRLPPKIKMNGCEPWSNVVAGILEHAGFASPCTPAPSSLSGDRDTEEMAKLAASMATKKREFRFPDLIDLCHELGLFTRLIGDGEDREPLARRERTIFSRILSKFDGRIFSSGVTFRIQRRSKDVCVYYVDCPA